MREREQRGKSPLVSHKHKTPVDELHKHDTRDGISLCVLYFFRHPPPPPPPPMPSQKCVSNNSHMQKKIERDDVGMRTRYRRKDGKNELIK